MEELQKLLQESKGNYIFIIGHDVMMPVADSCVALLISKGYRALSLNNLYALSQFSYPFGFYHLLALYANEGDFVFIFSLSGVSKSLVQACHAATMKKCKTFTFVGTDGGLFKRYQQNLNIYKVFHYENPQELAGVPYILAEGLKENVSSNPDDQPL